MLIMQYLQNLSNDFDFIKKFFEIEKTLMNVVITMFTLKAEQESQSAEFIQQHSWYTHSQTEWTASMTEKQRHHSDE